jgi:hypothetical protein
MNNTIALLFFIVFFGIVDITVAAILFGILTLFFREKLQLKRRAIICSIVFLAAFILSTAMILTAESRYMRRRDFQQSNVDISIFATLTESQILNANGIEELIIEHENVNAAWCCPIYSENIYPHGRGVVDCYAFRKIRDWPLYYSIRICILYMEDEQAAINRIQQNSLGNGLTYISYDNGIEAILYNSRMLSLGGGLYHADAKVLDTMIRFGNVIIEINELPREENLENPFSNEVVEFIYNLLTGEG